MAIYKKKSSVKNPWYCKFTYKDIKGITHQKKKEGFRTRKQALEYQENFLNEANSRPISYFKDLIQLYIADKTNNVKPLTLTKITSVTSKYIRPYFSHYAITEITPAIIRKWQTGIIQEGLSPSYTAIISNTLSSIFNFGIRYYNLSCNPAKIAGSVGSLKPTHTNFYTLEEYKIFSGNIDDEYLLVIFDLLYYTGVRIGELLALTSADINFNTSTITISKTYYRLHNKDYIGTPKSLSSRREIPIPQFLLQELAHIYTILGIKKEHHRVFSYTTARELNDLAKIIAKKSNLPPLRLHDFRHSHASYLINEGFSPVAVRDRLGHSSVKITLDRYSHLYQNEKTKIADNLQANH